MSFRTAQAALLDLDAAHKKARLDLRNACAEQARVVLEAFTTKLAEVFPDQVEGVYLSADHLLEEYSLEFDVGGSDYPDCRVDELDITYPDKFTKEELQEALEAAGFLNQEFEEQSW